VKIVLTKQNIEQQRVLFHSNYTYKIDKDNNGIN